MNQKALAKKNRETIGHAVKIFAEVGNNDVDMVEQINELTPEELEIIDAFENFEMEQFLKSEIYNHDEAVAAKILKYLNDIEEIRVAEKNLNDSKRKLELEGQRLMNEIACRKAALPNFYHYLCENEENEENGGKKRSEEGEKEEKREEEKGSEEEEGKERKEEEERKSEEKRGRGRPKKNLTHG
uniref:Uncharacterized protein n=1 Tax=Strongyloides venezuelensis TaxID=75913 RepID=A0A0K0FB89_STRVS